MNISFQNKHLKDINCNHVIPNHYSICPSTGSSLHIEAEKKMPAFLQETYSTSVKWSKISILPVLSNIQCHIYQVDNTCDLYMVGFRTSQWRFKAMLRTHAMWNYIYICYFIHLSFLSIPLVSIDSFYTARSTLSFLLPVWNQYYHPTVRPMKRASVLNLFW